MMTDMRGRVFMWGGAIVTLVALSALTVYFVHVGLDDADKLASVLGLFVAVAGLWASVYGLRTERQRRDARNGRHTPPAQGRSIMISGDNNGIASTGDNTTNIQR